MAHEYRVREIAQQAGLSTATVDRVLHGRPGVRAGTVAAVHRAVADLRRQAVQVDVSGRTFLVDVVVLAPRRFTRALRTAFEAELPSLRPAVVRARFHFREDGRPEELVEVLDGIARTGSSGVVLKAPDVPALVEAVFRLEERGTPTITFVTDVPTSRRVAYVGMDDRAAGATAAYLLNAVAPDAGGVLVSLSRSSFRGEGDREVGFRQALREMAPDVPIHVVEGTDGLQAPTLDTVASALAGDPGIDAVYSVGGGNRAVLDAFDDAGRTVRAFIAHDLDAENVDLLRRRRLTAVLHHDLRADVRRMCRAVMQAQGALPGRPRSHPSQIQVITPFNEPVNLQEDD